MAFRGDMGPSLRGGTGPSSPRFIMGSYGTLLHTHAVYLSLLITVTQVDRLLDWGEVTAPKRILDIGCGVGGSSRHMARKYSDANVTGVTLSPVQCASYMPYLSQRDCFYYVLVLN